MDRFSGRKPASRTSQIVVFKTYAFDIGDLSPKRGAREPRPRERDIGELLFPDRSSAYFKNNEAGIRSEVHERLSSGVYAFAFTVIALLYLGRPKTTREGRAGIFFTAFAICAAIRIFGIAGINLVGKNLGALWLIYGIPVGAIAVGLLMLRFNIDAPVIGLPRLRLPLPAVFTRRNGGGGAAASPS